MAAYYNIYVLSIKIQTHWNPGYLRKYLGVPVEIVLKSDNSFVTSLSFLKVTDLKSVAYIVGL